MKHPKIGTWVAFHAIAKTRKTDDDRRREAGEYLLSRSMAGQVVGVTYVYSGVRYAGFNYGDGEGDPGELRARKGYLVYQVRIGMRAKPVLVLPGTARVLVKAPPQGLPWNAPQIPYNLTDHYRDWRPIQSVPESGRIPTQNEKEA